MRKEANVTNEKYLNDSIMDLLKERKYLLEAIVRDKEKALKNVPKGHLRISRRKNCAEYFWRTDPKDNNGRYITKENCEVAGRLAQKDYDRKIGRIAKRELSIVSEYLEYITSNSIKDIYESMSEARKKLVIPVQIPDERYKTEWISQPYEPMGFGEDDAEYYSDSGIRVRSKSEIIIANMLEKFGVPYKYEFPVFLEGKGSVRPDFICLNLRNRREYVWEHFGMMDDEEYVQKNIYKINCYEQSGYYPGVNLIMSFETSQTPINSNIIKTMIRQYLL